ncbi:MULTISPECIES: hypothetical protein [Enterococcus]|uniref:hypothetical protein n=1 Tax=Enterococcus TaxID=1350 RepID=UPI0032E383DC
MIKSKSIWEIYIDNFLNNDVTITDITKFLKNIYNIKLERYEINVQPRTHWKFKLEKEIKDKKNIVYINCYENKNYGSKPLICGVTKTGKCGTVDFDFNKDANKDTQNYSITGRAFLNDKGFDYDKHAIYLFGCQDKQEAYLLEREIQQRFHLFGS